MIKGMQRDSYAVQNGIASSSGFQSAQYRMIELLYGHSIGEFGEVFSEKG